MGLEDHPQMAKMVRRKKVHQSQMQVGIVLPAFVELIQTVTVLTTYVFRREWGYSTF